MAVQEPTIVFEEPSGDHQGFPDGEWGLSQRQLGQIKSDFSKYQIRLTGFRYQFLTAGKERGEYGCKQLSKEYNHLEAGKGRLLLLCFSYVGTSSTESTKNLSPGSYASEARRISPHLALEVPFQICMRSPAAHHGTHCHHIFTLLVPADTGKCRGQTKSQVTAAVISKLQYRLSVSAHICTVNRQSL